MARSLSPRRYARPRGRRRAHRLALVLAALASVYALREHELFYPVSEPYARSLYPHWSDADGDCRTTRHEALAAASTAQVAWSPDGCRVVAGRWRDPWRGDLLTDPAAVDVDHLVPLAEAHRSGAHAWGRARREAFANDLAGGQLVPVAAGTNRAKRDSDPLGWMPPRLSAWCGYVEAWLAVKARWRLDSDLLEKLWTEAVAAGCRAGGRVGRAGRF